nr:MAG TPA: hypothetical protein [Bacteriophage sp.]
MPLLITPFSCSLQNTFYIFYYFRFCFSLRVLADNSVF